MPGRAWAGPPAALARSLAARVEPFEKKGAILRSGIDDRYIGEHLEAGQIAHSVRRSSRRDAAGPAAMSRRAFGDSKGLDDLPDKSLYDPFSIPSSTSRPGSRHLHASQPGLLGKIGLAQPSLHMYVPLQSAGEGSAALRPDTRARTLE